MALLEKWAEFDNRINGNSPDPTNGERFTFEDFKEQIEKEYL